MHTRNMTGLTDKAAERMKNVLLQGGDGADAAPIPGLGASALAEPHASFLSANGGAPGGSSAGVGAPPEHREPRARERPDQLTNHMHTYKCLPPPPPQPAPPPPYPPWSLGIKM